MTVEVGKRYVFVNAHKGDDEGNGLSCTVIEDDSSEGAKAILNQVFPGYVLAVFDGEDSPTPVMPEELTPIE